MRSISDQFLLLLPALFALGMLALFSAPMQAAGWSLAPNIAWVMTLTIGVLYPPAWGRGFAFFIGLLQDVLFATPLGAQALLTLLLVQLVHTQAARQSHQPFRIRWLEAAGTLVVWHLLLWALFHFVTPEAPSLRMLLRAGIISALWYPLFYGAMVQLERLLPPLK